MRLRISEPHISDLSLAEAAECLVRGELTMNGGNTVPTFEKRLGDSIRAHDVVACSSGTTALHLALSTHSPEVVIVPALTYVATVAAARYVGARVRFVDVDDTWTMNVKDLERVISEERGKRITVIPVHLYGVCADMSTIREMPVNCIIEDAAQALFSKHHEWFAGTAGDIGTFSFYANKLITTCGEGGAVVCTSDELAHRVRLYRGQGQDLERRYWHTVVGYNYRITAVQAAFGLGQLKSIQHVINRRRDVADVYRAALTNVFDTQRVPNECTQVDWLYTLLVPHGVNRDDVMARLDAEFDIETRPAFPSVASMPPYRTHDPLPVTTDVAARGISLPTHADMTIDDAARVVEAFITCAGA